MIEYSKRRRNPEAVWAAAPRWAVLDENARRRANDLPELRCSGLSESECSDRQKAWNQEAGIQDRLDIAKAEAKLLELRALLKS